MHTAQKHAYNLISMEWVTMLLKDIHILNGMENIILSYWWWQCIPRLGTLWWNIHLKLDGNKYDMLGVTLHLPVKLSHPCNNTWQVIVQHLVPVVARTCKWWWHLGVIMTIGVLRIWLKMISHVNQNALYTMGEIKPVQLNAFFTMKEGANRKTMVPPWSPKHKKFNNVCLSQRRQNIQVFVCLVSFD